MKTWHIVLLMLALIVATLPAIAAQGPGATAAPKYDKASEAVYKGTILEVHDRQCPVSGGMGSHLVLQLADGSTIEVHLSSTKFVHQYELVFQKGDVVDVTGDKVKFEGVDTILARKIKRGNDEFLFRDNNGKPLW
jgi:DNA/RNA endonuclease YhcR with UshA esterase domain